MKANERRLTKIETSLTPTQAIVLWLEEAHQFDSFPAYASWLKDQPDSAYPLHRLPHQVEQATLDALRGQPRERVDFAVRRQVRDVIFLFKLDFVLNVAVHEEQLPQSLSRLLLIDKLDVVRSRLDAQAGGRGSRNRREEAQQQGEVWRSLAGVFYGRYRSLARALLACQQRYFAGVDLLFPESRRELADMAEQWEFLEQLYNGTVAQGLGGPVELERMTSAAQEPPGRDVAYFVDLAKAETLQLLGETDAAADLVAPYL